MRRSNEIPPHAKPARAAWAAVLVAASVVTLHHATTFKIVVEGVLFAMGLVVCAEEWHRWRYWRGRQDYIDQVEAFKKVIVGLEPGSYDHLIDDVSYTYQRIEVTGWDAVKVRAKVVHLLQRFSDEDLREAQSAAESGLPPVMVSRMIYVFSAESSFISALPSPFFVTPGGGRTRALAEPSWRDLRFAAKVGTSAASLDELREILSQLASR